MHLKATGLGAVLLTAWAAPAWADVRGELEVVSTYDYPVLGLRVADEPVIQPSLSFDFIGGTEITAWASSTIQELETPFQNAGSEADLTVAKAFGPVAVEAGYFWYTASDTGDGYYRASVTLPFDFTMSVERLSGVSNATSFAVETPAYDLGGLSLQGTFLHTETASDEFEVARGTVALPLGEHLALKGEVFRTFGMEPSPGFTEDETHANVRLTLSF